MNDFSDTPLPRLPARDADSHKGNYGRVLLVGGSRGMAGAISLSAMAALRSGAGLVTVATPGCVQATVASFSPNYMTVGLDDNDETLSDAALGPLLDLVFDANVVAIGPGLGRSPAVTTIVEHVYRTQECPMIVDADGLNALAESPDALQTPGGPRILTPHPGEYARLAGNRVGAEPSERIEATLKLSASDPTSQTTVVLKGVGSVIASHDRYAINATGNPGMATGGSGDVLTGITAALVAQGLPPWEAARLATHVHGLAGDLAAAELGQVSLVASDLIDYLPRAFLALSP